MIVHHMSPDEKEWFREMLDIFINPALTLAERFDKISEYRGRGDVTDDSVYTLQKSLLEDIMSGLDTMDVEVIDVELLE